MNALNTQSAGDDDTDNDGDDNFNDDGNAEVDNDDYDDDDDGKRCLPAFTSLCAGVSVCACARVCIYISRTALRMSNPPPPPICFSFREHALSRGGRWGGWGVEEEWPI